MTDATIDRPGSPPKMSPTTTTALALGGGTLYATADWLLSGHSGAGWYLSPPPSALVDLWIAAALPTLHLVAKIFNNWLEKKAGIQ